MDRADVLAKRADEARRRYIALLAPYEGKRLMDIPASRPRPRSAAAG